MDRDLQKNFLDEFIEIWTSGKDVPVYTSGSTGKPKKISLSQMQLARSAKRTNEFFNIDSKSRLHSAISFEYIGGKMMIVRSLVAKCLLTFETPSLFPQSQSGQSINLMSVVPAQLPYILDHEDRFQNVRNILIGGSAISESMIKRILESHLNFWESYGMTETASHIALRKLTHDNEIGFMPPFTPLKGVKLSQDNDGSLIIQDHDIKVITNDLAIINPDGSFHVIGRKDDVIITGGKKVDALALEKQLLSFFPDLEGKFFVTSRKHSVWTNEIIMVAESDDQKKTSRVKQRLLEIIENIPEEKLPRWMRPKDVIIVKSIPLTNSGKIKRIKF